MPRGTFFSSLSTLAVGVWALGGCVPMDYAARPTLDEVRSGNARGKIVEDTRLLAGEIAGEIDRIDRGRREIHVLGDDRRAQTLEYDVSRTRVLYHDWDYTVDRLEAGDRIAFRAPRRSDYIETIRVLEPVQARSGPTVARPASRPRVDIIEGVVERVDVGLGTFEVLPQSGKSVTVSVPYNARSADIENFRKLRRGDQVRVEGEFINPESFQLTSLVVPRSR